MTDLHPRRRVRDAVVAALAAIPALGGRVHRHRMKKFLPAELPAAVVRTAEEGAETLTAAGDLHRVLDLTVDLFVKPGDPEGLADEMDALCLEVERAVFASRPLAKRAKTVALAGTTLDFGGGELTLGIEGIAAARLFYSVGYVSAAADPAEPA